MAITEEDYAPAETVTVDELWAALETLAMDRLGMSAKEFVAKLKAGELDPFSPRVARLAILARLIGQHRES